MTNQDVIVQILHEVTGKTKKQVRRTVKAARSALPDRGRKYDRILPPAEAERLLAELRADKVRVLAWLFEGATEARLDMAARQNNCRPASN
jgi:hypothetical protein